MRRVGLEDIIYIFNNEIDSLFASWHCSSTVADQGADTRLIQYYLLKNDR